MKKGNQQCCGSGIRCLFDPWFRDPGWDKQPGSYYKKNFVKILKLFDAEPGSGMEKVRNRDPGWNKFGSGMKKIWIRDMGWKKFGFGIRDKHPGSATLEEKKCRN
jgi:hypothetical protein